jgi:hypothetical protein
VPPLKVAAAPAAAVHRHRYLSACRCAGIVRSQTWRKATCL